MLLTRKRILVVELLYLIYKLFILQYGLPNERDAINDLIEKAILEAEDKGVKVLTLELLNQAWSFLFLFFFG